MVLKRNAIKLKGKVSELKRWKRIVKYPNFFISSKGRLWNISNHHIWEGNPDKDGYYRKTFSAKNGKQENIRIHRLVATHFISNPNHYNSVDHIDGNKTNNNINNLQWMSVGDNLRKAAADRKAKGIKMIKNEKKVVCLETGRVYDNASVAARETGAFAHSIISCCKYIYNATHLPDGTKLHWRYAVKGE